jgi:hypothetical protein
MQVNIADAFGNAQATNYNRRCLSTIATQDLDPAIIEQLYVRWITTCGVSFRMATLSEFRALLHYLNPEIDNWLPNSIPTIRTWTLRAFVAQKERIKREVQSALSKVHFTVDLWTSPNALAILGMIAHYTSESGQLEHSVLALRELDGKHSGPNIAGCIMQIVNDYGIASKVGYFMMDNADNNDTMMTALSTRTYHRFTSYQTGSAVPSPPISSANWPIRRTTRSISNFSYNAEHHRLRCNGHIINLAAQSFLFHDGLSRRMALA